MSTPSLQSRPNELAGSRASSRVAAGYAPHKARRPSVEAALAFGLGLGLVLLPSRVESFSDDLVQ
jgi:hypothetical protein